MIPRNHSEFEPLDTQDSPVRELQRGLEAALADVGRATAALSGAEARAEEAAADAAASKQELADALAVAGALDRRLETASAAAEVLLRACRAMRTPKRTYNPRQIEEAQRYPDTLF